MTYNIDGYNEQQNIGLVRGFFVTSSLPAESSRLRKTVQWHLENLERCQLVPEGAIKANAWDSLISKI
ncbi:hypothetical protein [Pseudomonas fluorescens]|uniref:hypothetical protein n=1 Tax=Pseudomonas fluorescens TaxID=294 RepID=UPI00124080AE|nr:hypothetical protein [Pseudomonas fluorescens]